MTERTIGRTWRCSICNDGRWRLAPEGTTPEQEWWAHYRSNHAEVTP